MVNVRKSSDQVRLRQFNIYHSPFLIPNSASRETRATQRDGHRENFHQQEVAPLAELPQWYVQDRQQKL